MKLDGLTSLIKEGGVVISRLSQRFPPVCPACGKQATGRRPRVNRVKTK